MAALDSARWRRVTRSDIGARVIGSEAFRSADMARRSLITRYKTLRQPGRFSQVDHVCLFIGHVKSGGSLLGALLDAHPDALVSDEADVLRYVKAGFRRDQIFHILEKGSRREAMKGRVTARRLDPYSLAVPGLYQGRAEHVRVIGDVRAGPTTRQLGTRPELLADLERTIAPTTLRFIHVVRNPFDPISAMVRRGRRTFENAIQDYADQCQRVVAIRDEVAPGAVHTMRYESFTADPVAELGSICRFLDLQATTAYLETCASIVVDDRPGERTSVDWTDSDVDAVEALIAETPFLESYRWA